MANSEELCAEFVKPDLTLKTEFQRHDNYLAMKINEFFISTQKRGPEAALRFVGSRDDQYLRTRGAGMGATGVSDSIQRMPRRMSCEDMATFCTSLPQAAVFWQTIWPEVALPMFR